MTEKQWDEVVAELRRNEVCCEVLGWKSYLETVGTRTWIVLEDGSLKRLFTECDNMARLLRAAVIEAGKGKEFVVELISATHPDPDATICTNYLGPRGAVGALVYRDAVGLMQATPAQQVERGGRMMEIEGANCFGVAYGQVWQANDPAKHRRIRVTYVGSLAADVVNVDTGRTSTIGLCRFSERRKDGFSFMEGE